MVSKNVYIVKVHSLYLSVSTVGGCPYIYMPARHVKLSLAIFANSTIHYIRAISVDQKAILAW